MFADTKSREMVLRSNIPGVNLEKHFTPRKKLPSSDRLISVSKRPDLKQATEVLFLLNIWG